MSAFPSGIPEIDITSLLQLDDYTLANACISNKYLDQLCSDDYFWRLRLILKGFVSFIELKDQGLFTTYRDLYIKLVTDAGYVVVF